MKELRELLAQAGLVGLDTMVFIYAFERHRQHGPVAQTVFTCLQSGICRGCVSVLALGEVLTGAKKAGDSNLSLRYWDVFRRFPNLAMYDVDAVVVERMADLRVTYNLRTPDAIHLATAMAHDAKLFLTSDSDLQRVQEITVVSLLAYS
ncbi:MAG: type II toxin-antitoxin system VapC family toxin [Anaerolineae bacterium]